MRIAFVVPDLKLSGGIKAVIELANGLGTRGHEVTLVAPRGTTEESRGTIATAVRVRETRSAIPPGHLPANVRLTLQLAHAVPRVDALVATYTPTVAPVLLATTLGKGVPFWLYADYLEMFERRPVERWLIRHAPPWFRGIGVYSRASAEELRHVAGVTSAVVGLGLSDPDRLLYPRRRTHRGNRVLYVGDERPRKGLADFLAAMERIHPRFPALELLIATKWPCAVQSSVPLRHFVRPNDAELAELYRQCDLFVSTSWFEGFGLPPLEAMACGAPVVVTDQRGAREYAENGINCLLAPIRAPDQIAAAAARILGDARLADRLGAAGVATAARFRWADAVARFESLLVAGVRQNEPAPVLGLDATVTPGQTRHKAPAIGEPGADDALVAVVIPNWNLREDTAACLESLRAARGARAQAIVVDNGSTDGSVELLRARFPEVEVIALGRNRGFAAACNVGIRRALELGAEHVLLLNNDTIVAPDALAQLAAVARRYPTVGLLAPAVYHEGAPRRLWHAGAVERWWWPMPQELRAGELRREVVPVDFLVGCALLVRRSTLERVGLLDERYFMYYEDLDYSLRTRAARLGLGVVPAAQVWHKVSESLRADPPRRAYLKAHYRLAFYRRNAESWRGAARLVLALVSTTADAAKRARQGDRAGARASLLGAVRGLRAAP
ncbi:MAG: glycosyltransferase [Chloroflexi bacterium]|nr:glycosyltransferase [Chloroflexota bacterium]